MFIEEPGLYNYTCHLIYIYVITVINIYNTLYLLILFLNLIFNGVESDVNNIHNDYVKKLKLLVRVNFNFIADVLFRKFDEYNFL